MVIAIKHMVYCMNGSSLKIYSKLQRKDSRKRQSLYFDNHLYYSYSWLKLKIIVDYWCYKKYWLGAAYSRWSSSCTSL